MTIKHIVRDPIVAGGKATIQRTEEDAEFKVWTKEFIEEYRPALQALANE